MFAETVMIAPGLSSRDLELTGKGQYIADFSCRVHVYYSRFDRALKASSTKRFGATDWAGTARRTLTNFPTTS